MKILWIVAMVTVAAAAGCNKQRATRLAQAAGVPSTSAESIASAYDNNPAEADARYNDRRWRISGVRIDALDLEWAAMRTETHELRFSFDDDAALRILRRGSELAPECEGDGVEGGVILFVNCTYGR